MNLIKHEKNIHELRVDGSSFRMGMFSDIHWDNPKCDWNFSQTIVSFMITGIESKVVILIVSLVSSHL